MANLYLAQDNEYFIVVCWLYGLLHRYDSKGHVDTTLDPDLQVPFDSIPQIGIFLEFIGTCGVL
jgi:hypothetical protein